MSHLEVFVTATAVDEEREVSYLPGLGGMLTSQNDGILGFGYASPRFCPVSDLDGENWAVVKFKNYLAVHRVAFLRDQDTTCRYRYDSY